MDFKVWLSTFVEEKGLDIEHEFTVENGNQTHFLSLELLVDVIKNSSAEEKKTIKDTIVRIDFINGDIMHYFNFLAGAYIKANF